MLSENVFRNVGILKNVPNSDGRARLFQTQTDSATGRRTSATNAINVPSSGRTYSLFDP